VKKSVIADAAWPWAGGRGQVITFGDLTYVDM